MHVLRLEDAHGKGPFNSHNHQTQLDGWWELAIETGWNPQRGPEIVVQENGRMTYPVVGGRYFGCPGFEAFNFWFPPQWEAFLYNAGFTRKVYDVPEDELQMCVTKMQCLFNPHSKSVKEI